MLRNLLTTARALASDKGVLMLALLAPVLYAFFYPLPYLHGAVRQVPVALVDTDQTSLTRQAARFVQANPRLQLRFVTGDEAQARKALEQGEVEGYALLDSGLRAGVLKGHRMVVPVVSDGSQFLLNKTALSGLAEALGTLSAGVELRKLRIQGMTAAQAAAARSPVSLQAVPVFNPSESYGGYLVPGVAVVIVHQTLLMAVTLWVGTWLETRRRAEALRVWLTRMAAFTGFGMLSGGFFFGLAFWIFDYGRGGSLPALAGLMGLMAWTVSGLGTALGAAMADRERALYALLFSAIPMVFLSGLAWPREALAAPLRGLADLLPTTPAIQGLLRVNAMGATWPDVLPQALHLAALAAASTALALWVVRRRATASAPAAPGSALQRSPAPRSPST